MVEQEKERGDIEGDEREGESHCSEPTENDDGSREFHALGIGDVIFLRSEIL